MSPLPYRAQDSLALRVDKLLVVPLEKLLALAPYARGHLRRARRIALALGIPWLLLGLLGSALVAAAASPRDQPEWLLAIFVAVAVLPGGAMTAYGCRSIEKHALVRALTSEPERVRAVRYAYAQTVAGDQQKVANVTLVDGSLHTFSVPS